MFGDLEIQVGASPSDAKISVDGNEIKGVRRIEIIAEQGRPTQAMLFMVPSQAGLYISMWDVNSETAHKLAEAIAKRLGAPAFVEEIYNEIIHFKGGNNVTS